MCLYHVRNKITNHTKPPREQWDGRDETRPRLPSPPLHPKGIQMLGTWGERTRERKGTNVDKWSESGVLSKDISLTGIALSPPSLS